MLKKSIAVLLWMPLLVAACSHTVTEPRAEFVPGEVLVVFNADVSEPAARALIGDLGLNWTRIIYQYPPMFTVLVGVPVGEEPNWVTRLRGEALVQNADLNWLYYVD